jgi:hypothetical protein
MVNTYDPNEGDTVEEASPVEEAEPVTHGSSTRHHPKGEEAEESETPEVEAEGTPTTAEPLFKISANGEQISFDEAKAEIKASVIEPVNSMISGFTEIVTDVVSGTLSGLLSRKRRVDK